MIRAVRCVILLLVWASFLACLSGRSLGAEHLATLTKNFVSVEISLERGAGSSATLIGVFTPTLPTLHLYSVDLKGELGVPTRLEPKQGGALVAAGALTADQKPHVVDDLSVYPEGPVTVRLPITLPGTADGAAVEATVLVSYMACDQACRNPVIKQAVTIQLPSVKGGPITAVPTIAPAAAVDIEALRAVIREELSRQNADATSGIRWRHPHTVADAEAAMAEAKTAGVAAFLDFTGPSCNNCQVMAKSILRDAAVIKAWNTGVPIEIDTDPPHQQLADWQQARFRTQNRPLYVRIAPDGTETRWSEFFDDTRDRATMSRFLAFLAGGQGADEGTGSGSRFWLLAMFGGLITLLMPCTYPMIPFTINFFAKQAAGGKSVLPLAAFYASGIVACFVGLGVLITGIFQSSLVSVAGHPITNLVIALLFIVLGLSLLGAFLLRLPFGLESKLGGGRSGYLGALVMGMTFAVTAFSCTAPFAGSVLAEAVASGTWTRAVEGMAVYGGTIAIPFFILAMSPTLLTRIPRAGAWMNEFKVVGGLVEIAAAFKFLAICDASWGWGIIGRSTTLAAWSACGLVIAIYLLGLIRSASDTRVESVGVSRLLLALAFLSLGLWMGSGLCGHNLGMIEGFFPRDAAP